MLKNRSLEREVDARKGKLVSVGLIDSSLLSGCFDGTTGGKGPSRFEAIAKILRRFRHSLDVLQDLR